ncbi:MAG: cytochrome c [Actinomycetota bacterium]|nr:cytochrome c [Actinomycetota bacterium]
MLTTRWRRRRWFALPAICGVLAGCGTAAGSRPRTGAEIFAKACGACHSLVGRPSPGQQGGDLLGYRFGHQVMLEFAREMPVRPPLDAHDLRLVVAYVVAVEGRGRTR